jgi:hypothetical protein
MGCYFDELFTSTVESFTAEQRFLHLWLREENYLKQWPDNY